MFQTGAQVAGQAVQGILQRIDSLAEKIGTTAQAIWQVYVGQARVEGIRDLCIAGVFILLAGVLAKLSVVWWAKGITTKEEGWCGCGVFAGLCSGALLMGSLTWIYGAIGELLNPQYWAFQHLTEDLKNLF